ncbi:MAG: MaoC family dehydratase [Gemmatimonadetes bacterium]|nr:MaoC family dehydratase [Gemmatimonadota bacterium]
MNPIIEIGDSVERESVVSAEDIDAFAEVVGDANPVHLDEAFARTTRFGGRIAHGMYIGGLISAAIATDLPGPGSIYLSQALRFEKPVRMGDRVTIRVEVLEIDAKRRARLSTVAFNQDRTVVVSGEALVLLP